MKLPTSIKVLFVFTVWLACVFIPIMLRKEEIQLETGRELKEEKRWTRALFTDVGHDVFGSFLALIAVTVGAGGGIGGGGLLVPVYFLVLNLGRFAIPLSKATIFGSAITHILMSLKQRHPKVDRPLIAFDISVMLEPMTLGGSVVGVLLNTIFPTWLITLCLIILLAYTTKITFDKAKSTWKKESVAAAKKKAAGDFQAIAEKPKAERSRVAPERQSENPTSSLLENDGVGAGAMERGDPEYRERELNAILESERKVPINLLVLSGLTWLVIFLLTILKGGHGAPSVAGVDCGSAGFWILNILCVISMVVVTKVTGDNLHKIYLKKKSLIINLLKVMFIGIKKTVGIIQLFVLLQE
eukprot:c18644_g1_i1.p1 GENE.c18644_g1_i1~~c18644_g1_i1.p1  ORF type:complete len:357 (+),score=130.27 c18644_g1_i1:17-1087(+)